ncbi:MAG: hypothetical protein KH034_02390 [Lachnospiraceae bacterium]|nr:hypothetical protein [Lachnospiraceae bacterium]
MDKHEYRVKTEQMLAYMEKKQYKKAMEIADTIDWHRVKSLSMLSSVSEIYEYNGENQKSRDILFIAYDRSPGSRKIVYRLGTLAIKIDDLQEAMDCYEEFLSIAPKDPNQYILKYKILKAENAPLEEQIEALVDFKKMEYVEKWAYELAKLYEAAGMIPECLEECDDLILWFSEGKYVLKAMELKMQHKPLTPLQQEKYDRFLEKKEEAKKAKEEKENLEATRKIEIPKEMVEPTEEKSVEEVTEEPAEEKVEEETAEEPAEETVEEEPAEETVEEEPAEETVEEETAEEPAEETVEEEAAEEPVEEAIEEEVAEETVEESEPESIIKETVVGSTLEEALVKGVAAAVNVPVPEQDEEPMSAQEKLEGILQNWEETQRAVEQEIERKKQQAEAEREAKRKERAAQSMFDTTPIIPDDIQQLLDDLENEMKASEEAEEDVEIEEIIEEPTVDSTEATEPAEELQEEIVEEVTGMETVETEEPIMEEEPAEVIEEAPVVEATEEPEEEVVSEPVEDFADDDDIIEKQFDISFQEETETKDDALEQLQSEMTTDADKDAEGVSFDTGFIVQGKYDLEAQSEIGLKAGLTEEQKKLFSYFVPVRGMSEQIVEVLENDKNCNSRYGTSRTGNILVVGRQGTGKTVLAVNVVKAIQKARRLKQGKVAIVTGEALNKKELSTVLGKLKGGALIVEKAGKMNQSTVEELSRKMEEQTGELLVVLEEQRKPLEKLLSENPGFKRKFTSKLELPIFINDELVTFGQTYAKENGYKIDEMGILALYSRIDILQKEDHAVTVTEVKEIIDHAIEKAQRVNIKHFFKRLFGKHTDNADRVILTEQDFK